MFLISLRWVVWEQTIAFVSMYTHFTKVHKGQLPFCESMNIVKFRTSLVFAREGNEFLLLSFYATLLWTYLVSVWLSCKDNKLTYSKILGCWVGMKWLCLKILHRICQRLRNLFIVKKNTCFFFPSSVQTAQTLFLRSRIIYSEKLFLFCLQTGHNVAITRCRFVQSPITLLCFLPPQQPLSLFSLPLLCHHHHCGRIASDV